MIFVSSGGFNKQTAIKTVEDLYAHGISAIELSGGLHSEGYLDELAKLSKEVVFQVHNYFPPPRSPFVFNLASLDPVVAKRSFQHVVNAMELSLKIGRPVYSFHAGFLLDPHVNELGMQIKNRKLFSRSEAMLAFIDRLNELSKIALEMNVLLLVENNVLSKNNAKNFPENPFLMACAEECIHVMKSTPDNVRLLIDVAHLKVSANSLGYDPAIFLSKCDEWISAYHLSDNDGTRDSNDCVEENSWFWPFIKRNLTYYSLEIYGVPVEKILEQVDLTKRKLGF